MERIGAKRTDLTLIWSGDANVGLDEHRIRQHWPDLESCRRLGANLFLVAGAGEHQTFYEAAKARHEEEKLHAKEEHFSELSRPENNPQKQAEEKLAHAQAGGDRTEEAIALTDMGSVLVRHGEAAEGAKHLEQALALAREIGDVGIEVDARANLGMAELATGKVAEALTKFGEVLAHARKVGDPFLEKMMLGQTGTAHLGMRQPGQALEYFESARRIALEQGDQRDEAENWWSIAICHDELGYREEALRAAQNCVEIYERLGSPQAQPFAEQLEAFRRGDVALTHGETDDASGPSGYAGLLGGPIVSSFVTTAETPSAARPSPLRMAYTAARSMAKFVASGFKTVSHTAHDKRLAVCNECRHHTGVRCRLCGCFTAQKAWMPHEHCPASKWPV
ncbi:MAG: tetratricopeptide repeat protein [Planctomycetales bacterium]|nr:tetratricopeptide repeat protein [Planctomycetales bacterium]